MELEFIRFERLESVWKQFEKSDPRPFVRWDYLRYIVRSLRWNPLVRVRIACVQEEGDLLMILPLQKRVRCPVKPGMTRGAGITKGSGITRGSGKTKAGMTVWRMLGDLAGCDIADALFCPDIGPEKKGECVRFALERLGGTLELNRIPGGSPLLAAIPSERLVSDQTVTYVGIPVPADWDDYIPSLSVNARQNVRKAYRRMEKDGIECRLELYSPLCRPLSKDIWWKMMRTYCRRRSAKYRKGVFSNETKGGLLVQALKYLHYITVKCLWFNFKFDTRPLRDDLYSLHFVLWDGDRVMAYMSGFLSADYAAYCVPRIAINADYAFYSPGCILVAETIRCLSGSRVRTLDLTRGDEPYKFKMGGEAYCTHDLVIR